MSATGNTSTRASSLASSSPNITILTPSTLNNVLLDYPTHDIYAMNSPFGPASLLAQAAAQRRQTAINNILCSRQDLGYDTRSRFDDFVAAFFHHHSTPADRIMALIQMFDVELGKLVPHLHASGPERREVREWKEKTLTEFVGRVMPALVDLVDGLEREVSDVLRVQSGEVKLRDA